MRILIANDSPFAHYYIRLGLAQVFSAAGHECVMWDMNMMSPFDAFDKLEPDLFIGQTFNLNESIFKCIKERPNMQVIMKASDWGPYTDELDREKYPVLVANNNEVELLKRLKDETGRPDYLYVHYHSDRLDDTHGHWRKEGFRVESMMNAADIFNFTRGEYRSEYASDVAFVGGRWGYKGQTIDKWFLPLCYEGNLNIKIFGNQPWGVRQYCGYIPDAEVRHVLASAKVCVNLSEPHSQQFGHDVVERPFKLASLRCPVVSDYVEDLEKLFGDSMVYAETPEEFRAKVYEEVEKINIPIDAYDIVMTKHTYFHRVADMMLRLGHVAEVDNVMETYYNVKEKLEL